MAALQDVVTALRHGALLRASVQLRVLSVHGGEVLQSPVLGWNEGLFLGKSDTVQTMDGPGQEITRYHSRQVCLLLLQSVPTSVLFDEWTQMVSYFLWRMSPREEVSQVGNGLMRLGVGEFGEEGGGFHFFLLLSMVIKFPILFQKFLWKEFFSMLNNVLKFYKI